MLAILDLVSRGRIARPFIDPSFGLAETLNGYWPLVMPPARRGLPSYPFYPLRSEPFWELVPSAGHSDAAGRIFSSMAKIRAAYAGARVDAAQFAAMVDPMGREMLRNV